MKNQNLKQISNPKFINDLLNFSKFSNSNSNFQILHLNINSLQNHIYEVNQILNTRKFDLIVLVKRSWMSQYQTRFIITTFITK